MQNPVVLILHQDFLPAKELENSPATGFQALFVSDFTEAFRMLRDGNVSCIVVDPHFKGVERLKEIRQLRSLFMAIPMILYGRFADPDLPRKYGEAGIQRCIPSGAHEELLEAIIIAISTNGFQPDMRVFGIDPEKCSPRLKHAIRLMLEEFRANPSVEEIACRLDVHPNHLEKEWRRDFGDITAKQVLIGLRLHYATFLMQNEGLKLKHVSNLAGFANEYTFYRSFRRHLGLTASTYRQLYTFEDFHAVYMKSNKFI
jgi:AraC-like DNA-binding protein